MSLEETFTNLAAFLNSLDAEGEQKFELSHSLVIICPDCGKGIAFRGRCPKCSGNSWIPAGHSGGIFEQMKAQRWRQMMREDDDTGSLRPKREPSREQGFGPFRIDASLRRTFSSRSSSRLSSSARAWAIDCRTTSRSLSRMTDFVRVMASRSSRAS